MAGHPDDDRPPADLAALPPDPEAFAEEPKTVLDDSHALAELDAIGARHSALVAAPHAAPQEAALALPDPADDDLGTATHPTARDPLPVPEPRTHTEVIAPDAVHQLPTQHIPSRRASTSLSKGATLTSSPVDAMKFDEIARTKIFLKIVLGLCAGGIIVAVSTGGDPVAKTVVLVGSIASALSAVVVFSMMRDVAAYDQRKLLVPGLPIVFGSMAGVYYWGTGSPVAAMLVYGIYFFSLGANRSVTTALYALVAGVHGILGLGIIFGVLEDHGVIRIDQLRTREQVAILSIIEALYFVAYFTARVSQRVTLDAMGKLEQAVRGNAHRDALLAEARADLDRVLEIGGPGRFTDQVIGSFRLGVVIGRGGMGEVYEAHSISDRREAAVKLLHPGILAETVHLQRFLREAQTASRLDCPYIVRVLEVGTTAGQVPFLAMERLRGFDLAHQLRRQRRLQLPQVKVLVEQTAIGLEAARVAGIVHRDLKPHNVFFSEEQGGLRRWKILD
ncbi:MAG TPA: protein kinase, partial [Kofleriaceae bacterium]|nr:protein kinase [Kofleriaceae bacterium]